MVVPTAGTLCLCHLLLDDCRAGLTTFLLLFDSLHLSWIDSLCLLFALPFPARLSPSVHPAPRFELSIAAIVPRVATLWPRPCMVLYVFEGQMKACDWNMQQKAEVTTAGIAHTQESQVGDKIQCHCHFLALPLFLQSFLFCVPFYLRHSFHPVPSPCSNFLWSLDQFFRASLTCLLLLPCPSYLSLANYFLLFASSSSIVSPLDWPVTEASRCEEILICPVFSKSPMRPQRMPSQHLNLKFCYDGTCQASL